MAHDGNASVRDRLDDVALSPASLHLDDIGATFLHDAERIENADSAVA